MGIFFRWGGKVSNAHLSRYSQASSLNATGDNMTARSGSAMGLSTRSVSGLVGEDESVTGVSPFFR